MGPCNRSVPVVPV